LTGYRDPDHRAGLSRMSVGEIQEILQVSSKMEEKITDLNENLGNKH
jgi:hypothetical protein